MSVVVFRTANDVTYAGPDGYLWNPRCKPSGHWVLTGAVEYGRGYLSGRVVRRYSLDDIRENRVPWFWRNGKQSCFPTDIDHGTHRTWMSPPLVAVTR